MTPVPPSRLIGTREFADRFDMDQSEVQRRAAAGRLPGAYKDNGRWKIDADEYVASLKGRRVAGRRVTVKRGKR